MARATSPPAGGTHRPAAGLAGARVRLRRRVTWGRAVWRHATARPGIGHLVRAVERFSDRMGNQFAAAITYFSFLSLVPILMVTFSAAGFVLSSRPDLLEALKNQVTALLGGSMGDVIDKAVEQRTAVGIIGLLVAAYSGLSWIGNVRDAVQAQWRPHWVRARAARQNFWMDQLSDLISLAGLLVAVVVSFSLTAIGAAAQNLVIHLLGLQGVDWVSPILTLGSFVLAIAADVLIFAWVYTIMPYKGFRADRRTLLIGSLAMAVAFEVLKAALTLLVSRLSHSPSGAVFGSVIGLLFFFNLVARVFLMVAAWIATGADQSDLEPADREVPDREVPGRAAPDREVPDREVPDREVPAGGGDGKPVPVRSPNRIADPAPQPVAVRTGAGRGSQVGAAFGVGAVLGWFYGRRAGRRRR